MRPLAPAPQWSSIRPVHARTRSVPAKADKTRAATASSRSPTHAPTSPATDRSGADLSSSTAAAAVVAGVQKVALTTARMSGTALPSVLSAAARPRPEGSYGASIR